MRDFVKRAGMLTLLALTGGCGGTASQAPGATPSRPATVSPKETVGYNPSLTQLCYQRPSPNARPGSPAVERASMTYDAARKKVVLFGLNETWSWDGHGWSLLHPDTTPPARTWAAMAYDAARGNAVLFGGQSIQCGPLPALGDTWTWDGTTWTKRHPETSPPPMIGATMIFDPVRRVLLMVGGSSDDATPVLQTWTWDGRTWTRLRPAVSPPARASASLAFDASTGSAVLFGKLTLIYNTDDPANAPDPSTWTFNGTTWSKHPAGSQGPPARSSAGLVEDKGAGNVVLFGGASEPQGPQGFLNDTWIWDGTSWKRRTTATSPSPRGGPLMAYDAAHRVVLLYGGETFSQMTGESLYDTWTWDGAHWREWTS
jgi:hypothetical protein